MDKALIAKIHEQLCGPYTLVKLRADGHELTASVLRVSSKAMRYGVVLYVDGVISGENLKVESEIGAKFYPLRTRQLLSAKDYASYRKLCGKRATDAFKKRTVYQYRQAEFRTGRALAMHLKKHCTSVEIIE